MGERLDSWKDIAAYLGRDVRTAQRWALTRGLPVHRLPGGTRPRVFALISEVDAWLQEGKDAASAGASLPSVAVLPFVNLTGDSEGQYFGDGLADDLINALVRAPNLRVIARTSSFAFSSRGQDVREIGAALDAAWLVEGSVRREGGRVRVSAQLVRTQDGCHAWSERYDRNLTDTLAIQDDIAAAIARALEVALRSGAEPAASPDAAAYDLWVKGRSISQQYTPKAFVRARECYEAAIARDPRFGRPYFGLADLYFYGAQFGIAPGPDLLSRAREAILQSLELDDRFGDAHALYGVFRGLLDYDWPGAADAFRRALELSPGSAMAHWANAWYHLVPTLRIPEALDQAREAVALDPLSPFARGILGLVFVVARQYDRAAEECRTAVQLAPGLWWSRWFYATALLLQGQAEKGFQQAWKVYELVHEPLVVGALCGVCGVFGRAGEAATLKAELERLSGEAAVPPAAFALACLGLGDDRVFEWFDKAIDARDPIATHLPSMPIYDGLRADPRFDALLARMNLGGRIARPE